MDWPLGRDRQRRSAARKVRETLKCFNSPLDIALSSSACPQTIVHHYFDVDKQNLITPPTLPMVHLTTENVAYPVLP
jgi:hypothetical protein